MRRLRFLLPVMAGMMGMILLMLVPDQPVAAQCYGHLYSGGSAWVTPGVANNLRQSASSSAALVGSVPGGERVTVAGGPRCRGSQVWYRVRYGGITGWTLAASGGTRYLTRSRPVSMPDNIIGGIGVGAGGGGGGFLCVDDIRPPYVISLRTTSGYLEMGSGSLLRFTGMTGCAPEQVRVESWINLAENFPALCTYDDHESALALSGSEQVPLVPIRQMEPVDYTCYGLPLEVFAGGDGLWQMVLDDYVLHLQLEWESPQVIDIRFTESDSETTFVLAGLEPYERVITIGREAVFEYEATADGTVSFDLDAQAFFRSAAAIIPERTQPLAAFQWVAPASHTGPPELSQYLRRVPGEIVGPRLQAYLWGDGSGDPATWTCDGALPSRIFSNQSSSTIGEQILYASDSTDSDSLMVLPPDTEVFPTGGFTCDGSQVWWRVEYDTDLTDDEAGISGYMIETDGSAYFLTQGGFG